MSEWPQSDHDVLVRIATLVEVLRTDVQELRGTIRTDVQELRGTVTGQFQEHEQRIKEQENRIRSLEDTTLRWKAYGAVAILLTAITTQLLRLAIDAFLR